MPITEMIKCPACGKEIPQDVENCPNCGAPISVIMNNDISGAPIDNSAAIDAMLRSASQFMEESEASLGLNELDIFDDEDEEEEEEKEEEEVFKKVTLKELPPELAELSTQQKDEIEAGGIVNLPPPEEEPPQPQPEPKHGHQGKHKNAAPAASEPKGGNSEYAAPPLAEQATAPLAFNLNGNSSEGNDEDEEEAPPKKKKEKKEKKPKKAKKVRKTEPTLYEVDENGNPVKGKKPRKVKAKKEKVKADKSGGGKASPAAVVIAAVVALAVGLGGGYFGKMFLFPDLPAPECQSFAQKAVDTAVERSSADLEFYITEAYVKSGAVSDQCIFRAILENSDGGEDISSSWYRVKIDHDGTNVDVSKELADDEYERLRNSDNSEERAQAAVLKSKQNELERCISEMKAGAGWNSANVSLINNSLRPYTESADDSANTQA